MKISMLLALLLFLPACPAAEFVYVRSTGVLLGFAADPGTGALRRVHELELEGAGAMTASPDERRIYAAVVRREERKRIHEVATIAVDDAGALSLLACSPVSHRPVYLTTAGTSHQFLVGAHYGEGKVSVWGVDPATGKLAAVQELELEERAHSAILSADGSFLLVPATGPNKVFQLRFEARTGAVSPNDPPFASGPTGKGDARQPRHLVFHPKLPLAYTSNERERPGVGVWEWNAKSGTLATRANHVTHPDGFEGSITTADLHLTPDARFLYVSNRDITDRQSATGSDAIVGFAVDAETGKLELLGHTPCERIPRSFMVNRSGEFLYVAGQGDGKLGAYRIEEDGSLEPLAKLDVGDRPSWVLSLSRPRESGR